METKKVILNTSIVGNILKDGKFAGHYSYSKGDVVEMPAKEADRYIERGKATPAAKSKS